MRSARRAARRSACRRAAIFLLQCTACFCFWSTSGLYLDSFLQRVDDACHAVCSPHVALQQRRARQLPARMQKRALACNEEQQSCDTAELGCVLCSSS